MDRKERQGWYYALTHLHAYDALLWTEWAPGRDELSPPTSAASVSVWSLPGIPAVTTIPVQGSVCRSVCN
jgi:hypothetical protein